MNPLKMSEQTQEIIKDEPINGSSKQSNMAETGNNNNYARNFSPFDSLQSGAAATGQPSQVPSQTASDSVSSMSKPQPFSSSQDPYNNNPLSQQSLLAYGSANNANNSNAQSNLSFPENTPHDLENRMEVFTNKIMANKFPPSYSESFSHQYPTEHNNSGGYSMTGEVQTGSLLNRANMNLNNLNSNQQIMMPNISAFDTRRTVELAQYSQQAPYSQYSQQSSNSLPISNTQSNANINTTVASGTHLLYDNDHRSAFHSHFPGMGASSHGVNMMYDPNQQQAPFDEDDTTSPAKRLKMENMQNRIGNIQPSTSTIPSLYNTMKQPQPMYANMSNPQATGYHSLDDLQQPMPTNYYGYQQQVPQQMHPNMMYQQPVPAYQLASQAFNPIYMQQQQTPMTLKLNKSLEPSNGANKPTENKTRKRKENPSITGASSSSAAPSGNDQKLATQDEGDNEQAIINLKQKQKHFLPQTSVQKLKAWFFEHLDHPYPSAEEKETLARETGLTYLQVSNWFTNTRKRVWAPSMKLLSNKGQGQSAAAAAMMMQQQFPGDEDGAGGYMPPTQQ